MLIFASYMGLAQQFGLLYSNVAFYSPLIFYFQPFYFATGPTCHAQLKVGPTHQKFRNLSNNHYNLDPLVRFPFHGYSNHIHNHCFEQTREQMKLVQNNTTLIYYNRYSILQPRYAYYCLQLQHIICYSLLICFTASDMDSHFTCAKNKNEHIRIRIGTEHQTVANEGSNNL